MDQALEQALSEVAQAEMDALDARVIPLNERTHADLGEVPDVVKRLFVLAERSRLSDPDRFNSIMKQVELEIVAAFSECSGRQWSLRRDWRVVVVINRSN